MILRIKSGMCIRMLEETIDNIQDYLMKNDEAIYLKLPPLSPQQFKKITDQLKKDGARYNPDKKAWYITEKAEQSKFQKYLPTVKESIHEKLNGYKADMQHTGDYEMASRKKKCRSVHKQISSGRPYSWSSAFFDGRSSNEGKGIPSAGSAIKYQSNRL